MSTPERRCNSPTLIFGSAATNARWSFSWTLLLTLSLCLVRTRMSSTSIQCHVSEQEQRDIIQPQ